MRESSTSPGIIRFGVFEADLRSGELRKQGMRIKLQEQPFQILVLLLTRAGDVVTREELREKLWPADTFVDFDHSLGTAIKKLREALGDSAENPRFVETLPRRGYRFIAQVDGLGAPVQLTTAPQIHTDNFSRRIVGQPVETIPEAHRTRKPWRVWTVVAAALAAALAVGGYFVWQRLHTHAGMATRKVTMVVLPFENLSGAPEQDYFSDGLTEEVITQLGGLQPARLGVIARNTAMRYKHTSKIANQIGSELGVDYILEGAVRREADRARITVQLIQVKDQTYMWTQSYERDLRDILTFHSDVARDVARQIQIHLTPQEQARLARKEIVDPEAHENYLKGLFHLNKRTGPDARRAITYLDAAVKKEPKYASAYVALADAYRTLTFNSSFAPADVLPKSEDAAKHALELDDQLAEAHASLAATIADYDWDWTRAESELQTALRLNPNSWIVHAANAHVLRQRGDAENSIREARRSVELDPVNVLGNFFIGQGLHDARRYDQAAAQFRETLVLNANFWPAHLYLGKTLAQQGRYMEAIEELRKAGDPTAEPYATIGYVYAQMGHRTDAQKVLADLKERAKHEYVAPSHIAKIYIALGDREQAFTWLEKGYQQRDSWLTFLKGDPMFDPIRSDPHFQDLLRRIGLLP